MTERTRPACIERLKEMCDKLQLVADRLRSEGPTVDFIWWPLQEPYRPCLYWAPTEPEFRPEV